ncbi:glycosyltransferase family 4 protein [Alphaproteobacteria bacterium LSUCC0684]
MSLHVILPAKEQFTERRAGAVARVAHDGLLGSSFQHEAIVFGQPLRDEPLSELAYKGISTWHRFLHGRNIGLGRGYLAWLKTLPKDERPALIEVHGRCALAGMIAEAVPDIPVVLVLHNDPREMKGARSLEERLRLARLLAGVFAVSDYLIRCFQDGFTAEQISTTSFHLTAFGADRPCSSPPPKTKTILIVGRMVPEKGILETAEAAAAILPDYPDWQLVMIGARRGDHRTPSAYEKEVQHRLAPLGAQASFLGFLPYHDVQEYQAAAEIILVPSQWEEPAGRVVIEALMFGAALIASRRGGIPEYAEGRSLLIDEPTAENLARAIRSLLDHPDERQKLQRAAWKDYPFTHAAMIAAMDHARHAVLAQTRG